MPTSRSASSSRRTYHTEPTGTCRHNPAVGIIVAPLLAEVALLTLGALIDDLVADGLRRDDHGQL